MGISKYKVDGNKKVKLKSSERLDSYFVVNKEKSNLLQ